MAFPLNPTNGQQTTINGVVYTYSTALTAWTVTSSGGSLLTASNIQTSGNISIGGFNSAVGNIIGNYFFGNGSQLTGITANGGSNYSNANTASFLAAFGSNVVSTTGNIYAGNVTNTGASSVTGNITVGNVLTGGLVSATGTATVGNVLTSGLVSATGTATVGNVLTGGLVSATGNITGSYIFGNGSQLTGITANGGSNYSNANTASFLAAFGSNVISTTGSITSGNILTGGFVSAVGNIYGGNVINAGISSVTGNLSAGNITTAGLISATGNVRGGNIVGNILTNSIVNSGTSATGNIGSSTTPFNTIFATATTAQYADVAERFAADATYLPGTVVELGGAAEITCAMTDLSENVFGVISTKAAYLMNSGAGEDATHPPIAMTGRVPVRVVGVVNKGDRLVSAGNGLARSARPGEATAFNVIGRSLENKTDLYEGVVEAIVTIK
jgi:hypothetical protein